MTISANVLVAALSAANSNGSRISEASMRAALEAALEVLQKPEDDTSLVLQPGEFYLVEDTEDRDLAEYFNREDLDDALAGLVEAYDIGSSYRDLSDYCNVYVVRRRVTVDSEKTVKITVR